MDRQVDGERRNIDTYRKYERDFRAHFETVGADGIFSDYADAYRCGARLRDDEPRSSWLEVRQKAVERWDATGSPHRWSAVEPMAKFAFKRAKERVRDGSQGVDGP